MQRTRARVLMLTLVVLAPCLAGAQSGELWGKAGVAWVAPNDSCEPIGDTGSTLLVDAAPGGDLGLEYMVTRAVGVELRVSASRHELEVSGGTSNGLDAGTLWLTPPALLVKYHLALIGDYRPYAGIGVAYAYAGEYEVSDELAGIGLGEIDFEGSAGPVAQLGLDYFLSESLLASFEVRYQVLGVEAELITAGGSRFAVTDLDFDPWVASLDFGWRF